MSKQLKIELLTKTAKLPTRAYAGDAGLDLYSDEETELQPGEHKSIKTGFKMALPSGCAGLIWDKGGPANKGIHVIGGVFDEGYRGEVLILLANLSKNVYSIKPAHKIAQMLIQKIEFPEIIEEKLTDKTERAEGIFGSSGKF